ncbi:MAG TPA: type II toxin-antitoxin system RelE/ParE family toxin, partial [Thermoanaerobaculia bacterium]|nr:type II toxin-antitoxin system RelE/ParE family toxin [Thermoanaerobaculia bacterium]
MSYSVRVSSPAAAQIRAAADWWLENRTKAPEAFSEEIEKGFELARAWPFAGEAVSHPHLAGVRRILLGRIRYYLYYRASSETETIDILALW